MGGNVSMDMCKPRIIAVMSTYEPTQAVAARAKAVAAQVDELFIVIDDSTSEKTSILQPASDSSVHLLPQTGNTGVANVLNAGVEASGAKPDDWLLFLDDDTELHSSFVEQLRQQVGHLALDMNRFIVGPSVVHNGDYCSLSARCKHRSRSGAGARLTWSNKAS